MRKFHPLEYLWFVILTAFIVAVSIGLYRTMYEGPGPTTWTNKPHAGVLMGPFFIVMAIYQLKRGTIFGMEYARGSEPLVVKALSGMMFLFGLLFFVLGLIAVVQM